MPEVSNYTWTDAYTGIPYEQTKSFLELVSKETKRNVLCKPALKVKDEGLIVGILTQTNQFIPVNPPVQDTFGDDLDVMEDMIILM